MLKRHLKERIEDLKTITLEHREYVYQEAHLELSRRLEMRARKYIMFEEDCSEVDTLYIDE